MEEYAIQINRGITINVNVSVKNVMYVKNIIFAILLHLVVKMENIPNKKQKLFQQILMKRKQPVKRKISVFDLHFS